MPEDNQRENSPRPEGMNRLTPRPAAPRRRFINRRNTILVAIGLVCAAIALVLVGLLAYRLGYVDLYIAGQVQDTLAKYGVRAVIKDFHTGWSPQTVEMLGVELYD